MLDPAEATEKGGVPYIVYYHGYWELAEDEALVIDVTPPSDAMRAFLSQRDALLKAVEDFRQAEGIDNPLDLGVEAAIDRSIADDAADLLGVSWCEPALDGKTAVHDLREEQRCERSWKRDGTVKSRSLPGTDFDGALLSDRDFEAVKAAMAGG